MEEKKRVVPGEEKLLDLGLPEWVVCECAYSRKA